MSNLTRTLGCMIVCVFGALVVGCGAIAAPPTSTPVPVSPTTTSPPVAVPGTAISAPVPVATPLSPAALEMIKMVYAFEDARNRGDTEAHVALVTVAKKELFRAKAEQVAGMGEWNELADCIAKDDRVICKAIERTGVIPCGVSELQIDSAEYVFREGKIDTTRYSLSQDSYSAFYPFYKALREFTLKNHSELLHEMAQMTREGGAIMVAMTKEYCATQK